MESVSAKDRSVTNPHRPVIVIPSAKFPPVATAQLDVTVATTDAAVNHCIEVFDKNKVRIGRENAIPDPNFHFLMNASIPLSSAMTRGETYYIRVSTNCNEGPESHTIEVIAQ